MLGGSEPDRQFSGEEDIAEEEADELRSLSDDITTLIEDGKTYAEAELAFQKSRFALVSNRGKSGIGYALAALGLLHLALIGLVVGAVMILAPLIGPGLATLAVVGLLLASVVVTGLMAKQRFSSIGDAFGNDKK